MKRIKIALSIIAAIAVIGIGLWYLITDAQTVQKNNEQSNTSIEDAATENIDHTNMSGMEH